MTSHPAKGEPRGAVARALLAALATSTALAQEPIPPTGPLPPAGSPASARRAGPIRRMFRHASGNLHRYFIGDPLMFAEPPLGASVYGTFNVMRSRADLHDFTVYESDFLAGTDALSPEGAARVARMASGLPGWLGPVVVEATPGRPSLAELRRTALTATFRKAGLAIVPERVVVGPSPFYGELGADAANNFDNMIFRDQRAARVYSVTPTSTTPFGAGAR